MRMMRSSASVNVLERFGGIVSLAPATGTYGWDGQLED
jgi:hypothetical protein